MGMRNLKHTRSAGTLPYGLQELFRSCELNLSEIDAKIVLTPLNTVIKGTMQQYPIQKVSEIYNKVIEMYNKVSELEISSWNVLSLLQSEVAYIGTGPILPLKRSSVF